MASNGPSAGSSSAAGTTGNRAQGNGSHGNRQPGESFPTISSSSAAAAAAADPDVKKKNKKKRSGRKRRNRRQSFAAPSDTSEITDSHARRPSLLDVPEEVTRNAQFQRISHRRNSHDSLESEALLDHRNHPHLQLRRPSVVQSTSRPSGYRSSVHRPDDHNDDDDDDDDHANATDRTPLIPTARSPGPRLHSGYGGVSGISHSPRPSTARRPSHASSTSTRYRRPYLDTHQSTVSVPEWDVNNPPSQPGSPRVDPEDDFDEVLLPTFNPSASPHTLKNLATSRGRDTIIDIDTDGHEQHGIGASPTTPGGLGQRRTTDVEDVCLPFDHLTENGEEDFLHHEDNDSLRIRRSRKRPWPDLAALEEWAQEEKEARTMEGVRAKKVNEPVLVGGRLRPSRQVWTREEEDAPFRWTYFNEELDSSLRSHTISGLQQLGLSFRELFIPDPPLIEDSSSDEDDDYSVAPDRSETPVNGYPSRSGTRQSSNIGSQHHDVNKPSSGEQTGRNTPIRRGLSGERERPKRYGPRPVFWLDVLQPTYEEMRVISRAFGIHKLTAEDIMEQEAREKVELFRNYYFVNYRTFEQDPNREEHMDAINMYFVVFKGGVLSFHFSQMPHPPNVRRRIRQLAEHQYTDSDWIAYAIIDNITDAYAPIVEQIEREVDDIDDEILRLHSKESKDDEQEESKPSKLAQKILRTATSDSKSIGGDGPTTGEQVRDILLRVGECRKKVMGLYRLLGNKADVIKGLAKRCNEQWQVAPRSDVGLYLGDIQDHIVTMTANLTHYENILSRAHSNYLAQINIRMNERAEQTNDVLGKLTVLGTIVLPMNIVTGIWGMNVRLPGEDGTSLDWFWGLTGFLLVFGLTCFFVAKKLYGVV